MPIDRRAFTAEFTLLLERFGREPHQILIARYFEYLNAKLTTEEFTAAARKLFEEARYWPAPIDFLHAAKGDPKRLAADAWGALLTAAQRGRPTDAPPEAIAALRRAGATFRDVETATDYRLGELQRAFATEYATHMTPPTPQLPPPPLEIEGPA